MVCARNITIPECHTVSESVLSILYYATNTHYFTSFMKVHSTEFSIMKYIKNKYPYTCGIPLVIFPTDAAEVSNFILSTDTTMQEIYRMDMETGSYSAIPNQNIFNPIAIDFDPQSRKVFYSDVKLAQIRTSNIDGTGMKVIQQLNYGKLN